MRVFTVADGWAWIFSAVEHWNAECVGWHVTKGGDRCAALEPIAKKFFVFTLVVIVGVACGARAWAADHRDGPGVRADPAADINDVFAWMGPSANRVYLVMTVFPFADYGVDDDIVVAHDGRAAL